MEAMGVDNGFADYLSELLEPLGGISRRRMFGGLGFWRDGLMFGLVAGDTLYFKADEETVPLYEAEGSGPFSYDTKTGRTTITSYWRAPERLFDETDDFVAFARAAVAAAARPARTGGESGRPAAKAAR